MQGGPKVWDLLTQSLGTGFLLSASNVNIAGQVNIKQSIIDLASSSPSFLRCTTGWFCDVFAPGPRIRPHAVPTIPSRDAGDLFARRLLIDKRRDPHGTGIAQGSDHPTAV